MESVSESSVVRAVIGRFAELMADTDVASITRETRLGDLGVPSIQLVEVLAELQDRFGLEDRLFTAFLSDPGPLHERSVDDIVRLVLATVTAHGG